MEPRVLQVWGDPPETGILEIIARHLEEGGLVAMPTETVYGFGAALQDQAIRRIQRLKERGPEKPFLVLVPEWEAVKELGWTEVSREMALAFWPGALTLVLSDPKKLFPPGIRSANGTVAVRQSPHPIARAIVEALGAPIVSTSANPSGGRPALSADEARDTALSLGAGAELWVLDAGGLEPSETSTILDCSGPEPVLLRTGSIPLARLRCVLPALRGPS